jgi:hypothetical protein
VPKPRAGILASTYIQFVCLEAYTQTDTRRIGQKGYRCTNFGGTRRIGQKGYRCTNFGGTRRIGQKGYRCTNFGELTFYERQSVSKRRKGWSLPMYQWAVVDVLAK